MTSASSVETFLPSMMRKPGVGGGGFARAAAAAAERRVTRGVARGVERCLRLKRRLVGGLGLWG
jgi:hypothetical protein